MQQRYTVRYNDSEHFDSSHFIHKYYLMPEDKKKLFPVDLMALGMLNDHLKRKSPEKIQNGFSLEEVPECIIHYNDIELEKTLSSDLAHRGLLAIAAYEHDRWAVDLTDEEIRVALNFNEWLRGYEKTLLKKRLCIEKKIKEQLSLDDLALSDYEIEFDITFYLREDDPVLVGNNPDLNDWDMEVGLLCKFRLLSAATTEENVVAPYYWGLGDNIDYNDHPDRGNCKNPVYNASHSYLFHELTDHHEIPFKHLGRIGSVWADIKVEYQMAVKIDFTGECVAANVVTADHH